MVEGRTARRSHSRKKAQSVPPLRRTPKASGLTARIRSSCLKWREALRGGSSWTTSHPSNGACAVNAARKPWTAAVCSMFLSSWRVLLPVTLRQSKEPTGSSGAMLHRFLATPTEVRSLRASRERPRSVRASRRPASWRRAARPNPSRGLTSWEALWGATPMSPASSWRDIQGQSEMRSRARFSAGRTKRGSMWSEMSDAAALAGRSSGTEASRDSSSTGSSPPGSVLSRR